MYMNFQSYIENKDTGKRDFQLWLVDMGVDDNGNEWRKWKVIWLDEEV